MLSSPPPLTIIKKRYKNIFTLRPSFNIFNSSILWWYVIVRERKIFFYVLTDLYIVLPISFLSIFHKFNFRSVKVCCCAMCKWKLSPSNHIIIELGFRSQEYTVEKRDFYLKLIVKRDTKMMNMMMDFKKDKYKKVKVRERQCERKWEKGEKNN